MFSSSSAALYNGLTATKTEILPEGCIRLFFTVPSPSMERDIQAIILLPSSYDGMRSHPILYALHGMEAPFITYSEMPPMRRGVEEKDILLCSFDADSASWYRDALHPVTGRDGVARPSLFHTFFFQEFLPFIDAHFSVHTDKRMLTGFSMGSYGALHYMLDAPQMFVSVSALSTCVFNHGERLERAHAEAQAGDSDAQAYLKRFAPTLTDIFGDRIENRALYDAHGLDNRLHALSTEEAAHIRSIIAIHTGVDDVLIEGTRAVHRILLDHDIEHRYREGAGGHNWAYWLAVSTEVFEFHWQSIRDL